MASRHALMAHWTNSLLVVTFMCRDRVYIAVGLSVQPGILGIWGHFSSVQPLSCVRLLATPWIPACQDSLSITNSQSLLKLMFIESVMASNHVILHRSLLLPPSIFPSIKVFSNESVLCIRRPKFRVSASASVFQMNIQSWFPLGWTGWISLQSKGLSRVFPNTTVLMHQFFRVQLSLWFNSHIHTWLMEKS